MVFLIKLFRILVTRQQRGVKIGDDLTDFGVRGFIPALALPQVSIKRKHRVTIADGRENSPPRCHPSASALRAANLVFTASEFFLECGDSSPLWPSRKSASSGSIGSPLPMDARTVRRAPPKRIHSERCQLGFHRRRSNALRAALQTKAPRTRSTPRNRA